MNRLICQEPNRLLPAQTEIPARGQGEALLKVRALGVCGTDYHAYRGRQPYFAYPRVLGHEIAADILELDADEPDYRIGDRVTVIPYLECGNCLACRSGKPNACRNLRVIGVHLDGGMQEYMTVPVTHLLPVSPLTPSQAAVVEPFAIGLHAVNRATILPGQDVLVIGGGPIGLAVMRFAKLAGGRVIAMDLSEARLSCCRSWAGADEALMPSNRTLQDLEALTGGELPSVVIDATGSAESMMKALGCASHGGKVVYVSLVQDEIRFDDPAFHKKELTLLGSRAATRDEFRTVIRCLLDGSVDASAYVTHRAPFAESREAFLTWLKPESNVIKAQIEFD